MATLFALALRLAALLGPAPQPIAHPRPVAKEPCDPESNEADDVRDWDDGDDEPEECQP